jgi:tyrosine-protein kinase Etk/Wzc
MLPPPQPNGRARDGAADEVRLLDVFAVLVRSWTTVAAVTLFFVLGAALVLFLQPRSYTTEVSMIPSVQQSGRGGLLPGGLDLPLIGRLPGGANPHQSLIEAILRSQSLRDTLQQRVAPDLGSDEGRRVAAALREGILVRTGMADRSIRVGVTGSDPDLAATIANAFPPAVNDIAAAIAMETAQRKREALELQLGEASERLAEAENALLAFERRSGAPAVEEQARRTLETASELQREIFAQEVRVSQMRRTATPDNPQLRAAEAELEGWRAQLRRLSAGRTPADLFLTREELPEMKLEYQRLMRERTKNEQMYIAVTAALASAESEAREELAVVSVLDTAPVPRSPSSPRPRLILMLGLLLGLAVGMFAAFTREYVRRSRSDGSGEEFFSALEQARSEAARMVPFRTRR